MSKRVLNVRFPTLDGKGQGLGIEHLLSRGPIRRGDTTLRTPDSADRGKGPTNRGVDGKAGGGEDFNVSQAGGNRTGPACQLAIVSMSLSSVFPSGRPGPLFPTSTCWPALTCSPKTLQPKPPRENLPTPEDLIRDLTSPRFENVGKRRLVHGRKYVVACPPPLKKNSLEDIKGFRDFV